MSDATKGFFSFEELWKVISFDILQIEHRSSNDSISLLAYPIDHKRYSKVFHVVA